jgi:hypothetical protein
MLVSDWKEIKFFKPTENWGEWEKIESNLIYMLDIFRERIATPVYISCGTQGRHSPNSYHYSGHAVDVLFPNKLMPDLAELSQQAKDMNFGGVGIYNNWDFHGVSTPGMHLDVRNGKQKLWIGIEGMYLPYNDVNLKRYFTDFKP